jgi:hypothetical protein
MCVLCVSVVCVYCVCVRKNMIEQWHEQTKDMTKSFNDMDDSCITGPNTPACIRALYINDIFTDQKFTRKSRENLWPYLQGLARHARNVAGKEEATDFPAPKSEFVFGETTEEQLKAVEQLTKSLPPELMQKRSSLPVRAACAPVGSRHHNLREILGCSSRCRLLAKM